jgi:ribosomal protein S18 acetylase RimI-like enzyme
MIEIRRYQASDHEAVCALHKTALLAAGAPFSAGSWDADLDQIQTVYMDNAGEFFVGTLEGRVVAMGALMRTGPCEAQIRRMRVHPDVQRRGFGQAIYDALEKRARELGYSRLHLDTSIVQVAAQRFYIKNGFQEFRRGKLGVVDSIFYEKRV